MAASGRPSYQLQRKKTTDVPATSVDFMVLHFSCVDESVLASLGKHHKEFHWLIAAGTDEVPLEIRLSVDKIPTRTPEVGVKFNGNLVYPTADTNVKKERAPLTEDFFYQVPYRPTIKGLKEEKRFEVRPEHLSGEHWYPATLLEQHGETFTANVFLPDGPHGTKTMVFKEVRVENVRDATAPHQKLDLLKKTTLVLVVPQEDPLHATLSVQDCGLITHFFARPTPPPNPSTSVLSKVMVNRSAEKVTLQVSEDQKKVVAFVGKDTFSHFFRREVRKVKQSSDKLKHSWTFQLGPFAEHCVQLERRYASSKVYTVYVDGCVLAESSAEDLECPSGWWVCQFRFLGEQVLEWDVNESDDQGRILDSRGIVKNVKKYEHRCEVYSKEEPKSFSQVSLRIDGVDFKMLPPARAPASEDPFVMQLQQMKETFGLEVPRKCRHTPAGSRAKKEKDSLFGFDVFFRCCGCDRSEIEQHDLTMRPR